jgi:hypothetical protein
MKIVIYTILLLSIFSVQKTNAQNNENSIFINSICKRDHDLNTRNLIKTYNLTSTDGEIYTNNEGIELIINDKYVSNIHIYIENVGLGEYKGQLPSGLKPNMTIKEITKLLGTPTYGDKDSFYEYDYADYSLFLYLQDEVVVDIEIQCAR